MISKVDGLSAAFSFWNPHPELLDMICRDRRGRPIPLKSRTAALRSPEHHIFCFINFRCEVMATTGIWMVCNHHPPMCFFNLFCWNAFSDKRNKLKARSLRLSISKRKIQTVNLQDVIEGHLQNDEKTSNLSMQHALTI